MAFLDLMKAGLPRMTTSLREFALEAGSPKISKEITGLPGMTKSVISVHSLFAFGGDGKVAGWTMCKDLECPMAPACTRSPKSGTKAAWNQVWYTKSPRGRDGCESHWPVQPRYTRGHGADLRQSD